MNLLGELEKAYEFFKTHPWVQEAAELPVGDKVGYCIVGVCSYYDNNIVEDCDIHYFHPMGPHRHNSDHYWKLIGALLETLQMEEGATCDGLIDWNDKEGRTVEEVNELWVNTINRLKKDQETYVPVSA